MSHANGKQATKRTGAGSSATSEQRRNRRDRAGTGEAADWGNADEKLLQRLITAVSKHGFAIRFGYTRDGGAYAIGIVGDGEPFTEYLRPTEDVDTWLEGFAIDYENDESRPQS